MCRGQTTVHPFVSRCQHSRCHHRPGVNTEAREWRTVHCIGTRGAEVAPTVDHVDIASRSCMASARRHSSDNVERTVGPEDRHGAVTPTRVELDATHPFDEDVGRNPGLEPG